MTSKADRAKAEADIREVIRGFVDAIRAKDIDGVMSIFAPEVVSFDLGPPLRHGGGGTLRERWRQLFESYRGPLDYELRELSVTAGEDVAFSHSLNRMAGTMKDGRRSDRWLRWTACYVRTGDSWRIVHEQVSLPVDLGTGKALTDLQP